MSRRVRQPIRTNTYSRGEKTVESCDTRRAVMPFDGLAASDVLRISRGDWLHRNRLPVSAVPFELPSNAIDPGALRLRCTA